MLALEAVAQRVEPGRPQHMRREAPAIPKIRVSRDALNRDPATGLLDVETSLPSLPSQVRSVSPVLGEDQIQLERLLASWIRRGEAAGNVGDVYDNRDRGHSRLAAHRFPALTHSDYDEQAKTEGLDYGLNTAIRFGVPTFGNSSTALTDRLYWRSQTRHAMTSQDRMQRVAALYWSNHLYVYPEHRDHDPNHGDLFPAAIPYLITSQGSSGSDRPFLQAIALIMAAYRPETKAALIERGHLAAVTGMILRRGMRGIESDADYLDGLAHPSAFEGEHIELERMVALAHALTPDRLPPIVRLQVREAPTLVPGGNVFVEGVGEALFVTDAAIGWIARALTPAWRFVLQANTDDAVDARFHWRVLRGDEDRIVLRPTDVNGTRVEVVIPWHEPYPVPGRPDILTSRVDIGVFAEANGQLSAPAFFSLSFPPREERRYSPDGRLLSLAHEAHARRGTYADPILFPSASWTDRFDYTADGRLLGWTREIGGETQRFTRHGLLVTREDTLRRAVEARRMRYPIEPGEGQRPPVITPTVTDEGFRYSYRGDDDQLGAVTPLE
jgi:YD repeat-containing protein